MNKIAILSEVLAGGFLLGGFFFGALWWTVRKRLTSPHAALWFLGSTILRTVVTLAGFYLLSHDDWRKLVICLLGFFIARVVVTRITRPAKEGSHAT